MFQDCARKIHLDSKSVIILTSGECQDWRYFGLVCRCDGKLFRCLPKLCQGLPRGLLTNHLVSAPDIFLIERISCGVKASEQIQLAVLLSSVLTFILNNCQRFEGLT